MPPAMMVGLALVAGLLALASAGTKSLGPKFNGDGFYYSKNDTSLKLCMADAKGSCAHCTAFDGSDRSRCGGGRCHALLRRLRQRMLPCQQTPQKLLRQGRKVPLHVRPRPDVQRPVQRGRSGEAVPSAHNHGRAFPRMLLARGLWLEPCLFGTNVL